MMRPRLVLFALFVLSASAFGRPVKEFTEPNTIVFEQKRKRLGSFAESPESAPEEPFPWLFVGLGALLLAGATPFALRAFRQVEQEHLQSVEAHLTEAERRAAAKELGLETKPKK